MAQSEISKFSRETENVASRNDTWKSRFLCVCVPNSPRASRWRTGASSLAALVGLPRWDV